ncbi:hypothetical protein F4780DRAFT_115562 [Xylariomycetidae sp. FL0641]|nr:hypothetical protein F4780DRAFT_115562 [Xylariomycetidae sp. FL0641]
MASGRSRALPFLLSMLQRQHLTPTHRPVDPWSFPLSPSRPPDRLRLFVHLSQGHRARIPSGLSQVTRRSKSNHAFILRGMLGRRRQCDVMQAVIMVRHSAVSLFIQPLLSFVILRQVRKRRVGLADRLRMRLLLRGNPARQPVQRGCDC